MLTVFFYRFSKSLNSNNFLVIPSYNTGIVLRSAFSIILPNGNFKLLSNLSYSEFKVYLSKIGHIFQPSY